MEKTKKDLEIPRKLFHAIIGIIAAMIGMMIDSKQEMITVFTGTTLICIVGMIMARSAKPNRYVKILMRSSDSIPGIGAALYLLGVFILIYCEQSDIITKSTMICGIMTLAIGDPIASIIGKKYGERHIFSNKSLIGTIAGTAASYGTILIVTTFYQIEINHSKIILLSYIGMIVEFLLGINKWNDIAKAWCLDNLFIPLSIIGASVFFL